MWFSISASGHADNLSRWVCGLVTGYIIGLVSAIVGIGGGTMTTPFLVYNNINIKNAIATSAAVGMPIAIAGSLGFIITGIGAEGVTSGLGFYPYESAIKYCYLPVSCLHHLVPRLHIVLMVKNLKKVLLCFWLF